MAAVYGIEIADVLKLAGCPKCGAGRGEPCVRRGAGAIKKHKALVGAPVATPHPQRVQEAKRAQELAEPQSEDEIYADQQRLEAAAMLIPSERFLQTRELADYCRRAQQSGRETAVKVSKRDLLAMIVELQARRESGEGSREQKQQLQTPASRLKTENNH